jgi:antitoxin component of MazEF toxin-antitoxin module
MFGKMSGHKPTHNILTESLGITISSDVKINHQNKEFRVTLQRRTPQFIIIIKEETKIRRSRLLRFIN